MKKMSFLQESIKQKKSTITYNSQLYSSNEEESIYEDDNSSYSSEMDYSKIKSDKKEDLNLNKSFLGSRIINKNNIIHEQYYKVNIKNIKLVIYDFNHMEGR